MSLLDLTPERKLTVCLIKEYECMSHLTMTKQCAVGKDLAPNFFYVV